jgi:hypothetical protein
MWKKRAARRSIERAHDSQQDKHCINHGNRLRFVKCEQQQQKEANSKSRIAKNQNFAAVKNVRHMASREEKHDAGQELGQANQSEVERAFGDFVDLPADGDGLHFQSEHNKAARTLKYFERGIAERRPRIVFRVQNLRL